MVSEKKEYSKTFTYYVATLIQKKIVQLGWTIEGYCNHKTISRSTYDRWLNSEVKNPKNMTKVMMAVSDLDIPNKPIKDLKDMVDSQQSEACILEFIDKICNPDVKELETAYKSGASSNLVCLVFWCFPLCKSIMRG